MTKILAPIDYSDHSVKVLELAGNLAAALGADLHVLYVWETMPHFSPELMVTTPSGPRRLEEIVHENAEREMNEFLTRCRFPESVKIHSRIASGPAASTILKRIAADRFDLVVIGTHGRGGVKHWMLGSVAERIVRFSPMPVITVREPRKIREVQHA